MTGTTPVRPGDATGALHALAELNLSLAGGPALDLLPRMARDLTGSPCAVLWEAAPLAGVLVRRAVSVDPALEGVSLPEELALGAGAAGWAARHRQPLYVADIRADSRVVVFDWAVARGLLGLVGVPLVAGEELVGALTLHLERGGLPDGETRALLSAFAGQAAVALHNARLFREVARRGDRLRKVADLTRALSSALDLEAVLSQVSAAVVDIRPGILCVLRLVDRGRGGYRLAGMGGVAPAGLIELLPFGQGLTHVVAESRRPLLVGDSLNDARISDAPWFAARELGVYYGVPIEAHSELLGVLSVNFPRGVIPGPEEREAIDLFGHQAAVAIRNAGLFAELEARVRELRNTQAQLVQAAKLSAVGQLVAGVAHELNNPLSVVIGYGQLLLRRDPPEDMRSGLEAVVAQADRMARIVQGLLLFARQRLPERALVDVGEVLEQAVALRATQLRVSNIEVELAREPGVPPVMGDANHLQQVFLNLILNAEQAIVAAKVGGRVRLAVRPCVGKDGESVLVTVTDDGPGIAAEVLPRVFDPFFTTKPVGSGTGLGLSISYGIIEQHGGHITVSSEAGATTFAVTLPAGA